MHRAALIMISKVVEIKLKGKNGRSQGLNHKPPQALQGRPTGCSIRRNGKAIVSKKKLSSSKTEEPVQRGQGNWDPGSQGIKRSESRTKLIVHRVSTCWCVALATACRCRETCCIEQGTANPKEIREAICSPGFSTISKIRHVSRE